MEFKAVIQNLQVNPEEITLDGVPEEKITQAQKFTAMIIEGGKQGPVLKIALENATGDTIIASCSLSQMSFLSGVLYHCVINP